MTSLHSRYLSALLLLLASIYLFLVNQQVPMFADDLCRAQHDFDFSRALGAARGEYMGWSGRYPVMLLNNMFFAGDGTGITILSVLNSLFLFIFVWFVVRQFSLEGEIANACLLLVFIGLIWFSTRSFGEAVLWKTGSVQYFWGTILATLLLVPMARAATGFRLSGPNFGLGILFVGCCLLGGAWLENVSAAIVVLGLGLWLYAGLVERVKIPGWILAGLAAWTVGTIVLIAAPGNYVRVEVVARTDPFVSKFLGITSYLLLHMDPLIMLTIIGFLVIAILQRPDDFFRRLKLALVFFLAGILAAYATIGAPVMVFSGRVAFPTQMFFVLTAVALFPAQLFAGSIEGNLLYARRLLVFACFIILAGVVFDGRNIYKTYQNIGAQENHRQELIGEALQRGQRTLKLPPLYFSKRLHTRGRVVNKGRRFARDITIDPSRMTNTCYANYHGLKKVAL